MSQVYLSDGSPQATAGLTSEIQDCGERERGQRGRDRCRTYDQYSHPLHECQGFQRSLDGGDGSSSDGPLQPGKQF